MHWIRKRKIISMKTGFVSELFFFSFFIVLLELLSHVLALTAMKKILHLLLIQKRKNLLLIQRKKNRSLTYQMELLQALLLRGIVVFHNENS